MTHDEWLRAVKKDMREKGLCGEVNYPQGVEHICVLNHPCPIHSQQTPGEVLAAAIGFFIQQGRCDLQITEDAVRFDMYLDQIIRAATR